MRGQGAWGSPTSLCPPPPPRPSPAAVGCLPETVILDGGGWALLSRSPAWQIQHRRFSGILSFHTNVSHWQESFRSRRNGWWLPRPRQNRRGQSAEGGTGGKRPARDALNNKQTLSKQRVKNGWDEMNSNRVSSGLSKPCLMSAWEAGKGPDPWFSLWASRHSGDMGRGWRRNVGRGVPGRFWDPVSPPPPQAWWLYPRSKVEIGRHLQLMAFRKVPVRSSQIHK